MSNNMLYFTISFSPYKYWRRKDCFEIQSIDRCFTKEHLVDFKSIKVSVLYIIRWWQTYIQTYVYVEKYYFLLRENFYSIQSRKKYFMLFKYKYLNIEVYIHT